MTMPALPAQNSINWYAHYAAMDAAVRAAPAGGALPQFHGVRYTSYGHSFGNVQSDVNAWAGSVYPARLRDLLHADPALFNNRCQNGTTMAQIVTQLQGTWTVGTYGLVTLMGFKNNMGQHTTISAFQQSIRDFLNYLLGASAPPTILVIKDVYATSAGWGLYGTGATNADVDTYNAAAATVLAEYPAAPIIVADPQADGWDTATMLARDGLHPNDHGMAHITASALKALAAAPYRDGLNYGYATAAAPPPSGPVTYAADTFTRTASVPGTTSTGSLAWNIRGTSGTPLWSTNGTQLVGSNSGGESACVVDTGHSDGTVQGTLSTFTAGNVALTFRVVDGSNLWLLYAAAGGYQLVKRITSNYTFLSGTGPTPAAGDVLKVVLSGNSITAYVNGTAIPALTTSDPQFATATAHGFWATNGGGTFDTFSATS